MEGKVEDIKNNLIESFQRTFEEKELLAKVIEFFPYPIQIFTLDGTAKLINKAALEMIGIRSMESHVGIYNVFEDPIVQKLGFMEQIKQVLIGKTIYINNFNVSYQDLIRYFNVEDRDIQTISTDITCFPLLNDNVVEFFVAIFIFKKIYYGREEIGWGKQYIEKYWKEPFDINKIAKASCLSKAHFTKLFKNHTGMTPHDYYINFKIIKLKEKLLDTNLSIVQAFADCNIDYNGYFAKLFKKKVGLTPSQYRKNIFLTNFKHI